MQHMLYTVLIVSISILIHIRSFSGHHSSVLVHASYCVVESVVVSSNHRIFVKVKHANNSEGGLTTYLAASSSTLQHVLLPVNYALLVTIMHILTISPF